MKLNLYNSINRQVEPFQPYNADEVTLYTCGPTVYNYAHIGNLRTYISEDILEKTLLFLGYNVKRCMNVTDVGHLESDADDGEDKMLQGAKREHKSVWQIAEFYSDAFFADLEKLNIKKPEIIAKATDYIEKYIDFIQVLEKKGHTYFSGGNVYFDISTFPDYTKLSKLDLDSLQTATRVDVSVDSNKKNPQDFVLWFTKSKFEQQAMKWDSPWGVGYPGWHIECSVIALENLGKHLDIHCGGIDHIPVHHTNEIAQTESYTGEKWVNYWWHAEFLVDDRGKMSKSKGEFLTLALLENKNYSPLEYRFYCLGSHYRKQLPFSFEKLDMAKNAYQKLKKKTLSLTSAEECSLTEKGQDFMQLFKKTLADDLNTANALTVVYDVLKSDITDGEKKYLLSEFDKVLSLDLLVDNTDNNTAELDVEQIEKLIAERVQAKKDKNYQLADSIRDQLGEMGIVLTDTANGTTWEYKN